MDKLTNIKGNLVVTVKSHGRDSRKIPKQLEIYDSGLSLLHSYWIRSDESTMELLAGVYLVRLILPSAIQFEKVVVISNNDSSVVQFDLTVLSPKESQEWVFFNKSNAGTIPVRSSVNVMNTQVSRSRVFLKSIPLRKWKYVNNRWELAAIRLDPAGFLSQIGESYSFSNVSGLELLEVQAGENDSYFVVLPQGEKVKVVLRATQTGNNKAKVEAFVSTNNKDAEAILGFMASGDMPRAGSIMADIAESLLQDKVQDVDSATIGAYYLVRAREWNRTHNWINNLSDWFPFLADGPLLCAWEIIGKEKKPEKKLIEIRKLLLDSVRRGIPVYTEGLKLLYEGLVMLKNQSVEYDPQVVQGLEKISSYMAAADLTKDYVSFYGTGPDKPGSGFSQGNIPVGTPTTPEFAGA